MAEPRPPCISVYLATDRSYPAEQLGPIRRTGRWQPADAGRAGADDVLDDLGEVVMDMKGTVVAVPSYRMPTATGVAAVYRS
jgi:hypothetical protein